MSADFDTDFDPPPPDWLADPWREEADRPPPEVVVFDAGRSLAGLSPEVAAEVRYDGHLRGPVVIRREVQR